MSLRFDHGVLIVSSLAEATAAFRDAGFTVRPGGNHDELPTANALVVFRDGGYLELLATREPETRAELRGLHGTPRWEGHVHGASAVARRFLPRLAGPDGVGDFVILRPQLARFASESRRRGFVMTGPVGMSRERPDGGRIAWDLLFPDDDALPFLIEDRTPRERRVAATPEAFGHANGASGVAEVFVRSTSVPRTALLYSDLFGLVPRALANGDAELDAGGWRILLTQGSPAGACAVSLAGVRSLPAAIEALGVRAARG